MVKSHEKKCLFFSKLSLQYDDMVKYRRNVNFEEMDTERSTGKNDEF